jgi:uncharacterized membrane protein YsdA (DUF1294 family)
MSSFAAALWVMNIVTFALFGLDKWKAVHQRWRIPEIVLLGFAALGGALGGLLGMYVFHHKTRKRQFRLLLPLFLFLQIFLLTRF